MKLEKLRFEHYTIEGYEVIVGKDATSNDYLSLKLAKANDYWFHVKGCSGSHVILQSHSSKLKPAKSTIEKVASLAAYHSSQQNGGQVSVIYTLAKYVKRAHGAAAGTVTVSKEKTLLVRPRPM